MAKTITKRAIEFNRYLGLDGQAFGQSFSEEVEEHGYFYDDEQRARVFGVIGKRNVYRDIQACKAMCDDEIIRQNMLKNGTDIIPDELFADVSIVPRDMLEAYGRHKDIVDRFNALPAELRFKYNNDPMQFLKEYKPVPHVNTNISVTTNPSATNTSVTPDNDKK